MAKRFTDTGKWEKAWFRKLPPAMKCAWMFLCDRCDHAGVWDIDEDTLHHFVGMNVSLNDILKTFDVKVLDLESDKLFLPGFIEFQYGELSMECKAHIPVIKALKKHGLWEGYRKGIHTLEEKEKEMEEEKETEKDQEEEKEKEKKPPFNFDAIYLEYPLKEGKADGIAECKRQIKSQKDFNDLFEAVKRYKAHVTRAPSHEGEFIASPKHFGTFMRKGRWKECLDADFGQSVGPPNVRKLKTREDHVSEGNRDLFQRIENGEFGE